jgi:hypothetical protein
MKESKVPRLILSAAMEPSLLRLEVATDLTELVA